MGSIYCIICKPLVYLNHFPSFTVCRSWCFPSLERTGLRQYALSLLLVLVRCFYWTTRVSQCQLCGQQVLSPMGKTSFGEVYLSKRAKLKSLLLSLSCSLVRKPFIVHSLGCCKQSLCATDMQGKHNLNC